MTKPYDVKYLSAPGFGAAQDNKIAYYQNAGKGPGLIWCGGLKSDMDGSKALALHDWADKLGRGYVRFDYFGHGVSTGRFRDGTISRWAAETALVIDELTEGPQILIGSSMGGWVSLLAAMARPERVKGLLLIAPAPDFTEKLMWAGFSDEIRNTIMEEGIYFESSDYEEPYEISRALIEDGRKNQILDAPIHFEGPVRILQGMQDNSVPWTHAQKLINALTSTDVEMTLVKNGGHSLSEPKDIKRMLHVAQNLVEAVEK